MKRGNVGPVIYGSPEEPIDPECLSLCDALNGIEGIETISSCCGHGFAPYRIYFVAEHLADLCPILELIDESEEWKMRVSMATGGMEIYFVLDGVIGEASIAAAVAMANKINVFNRKRIGNKTAPQEDSMNAYDWPHLLGKLAPKVIECLPLASMSAAEIERVKEVLVEIDRMEQRGLKAEALTREAQQDVANLDKQCSEIALNHGREIERLLVEIDRMEAEDAPVSSEPVEIEPAWVKRFWSLVDVRAEDECWPWLGSKTKRGYGMYKPTVQRKKVPAHRLAYEIAFGMPDPKNDVHHKCTVIDCMNPKHLEELPEHIHVRLGASRANINRNKTHCIRGHELIGYNLRVDRVGHRSCNECSRQRQRAYYRQARRSA